MQGRSRCTSDADDLYIWLLALRNRRGTATQFKTEFQLATGQRVSTQTIRNRLQNATMNARRAILTRVHRIQRIELREPPLVGNA